MFCDLVDSVGLSERLDPETLRDILRDYQQRATKIVEAAGGMVARYHGDGILAYFGFPAASEDDAERAIGAGLNLIWDIESLSQSPEKLFIRVGIATGMVVVGELVASAAADHPSIVGGTPNLAARLQSIAEPNTIIISPSTRRLAGGLFEYADLGSKNLKGFLQPVRAWQVIGESVAVSRFESLRSAHTPLVGRFEEVELLMRRWTRAKQGEGQVVLVTGEAGIGARRALGYGNGWMPHRSRTQYADVQALLPKFSEMAAEADRDPVSVPITIWGAKTSTCSSAIATTASHARSSASFNLATSSVVSCPSPVRAVSA
jgi:class 3 adenylate cyclase